MTLLILLCGRGCCVQSRHSLPYLVVRRMTAVLSAVNPSNSSRDSDLYHEASRRDRILGTHEFAAIAPSSLDWRS